MKAGYQVHTACTNEGRFTQLEKQHLILKNITIERKISLMSNLKSIIQLYRLIKKERYDIVHVHTPIAAVLGRIAAKLAGAKHIIYTAHGFYFHEGMSKPVYNLFYLIEKYMARYCTDWLLLQSKEDFELCVEKKFKEKNRIIHISNGVDIYSRFNPTLVSLETKKSLKEELNIHEDDTVFLFIGRLVEEKGIFELLDAFEKMVEKVQNATLLLVGDLLESERDKESFVKLKERLSQAKIISTGFRTDIVELISISDVFVLPSYREGVPRSIIEAMAMGKPIIATNIRGCREEVFDCENGFLVPKKNVEALYEKMLLLFENEELRVLFGEKSRHLVEQHFNEETVVNKQLELFDSLENSD